MVASESKTQAFSPVIARPLASAASRACATAAARAAVLALAAARPRAWPSSRARRCCRQRRSRARCSASEAVSAALAAATEASDGWAEPATTDARFTLRAMNAPAHQHRQATCMIAT